jgi:hypothetical protein
MVESRIQTRRNIGARTKISSLALCVALAVLAGAVFAAPAVAAESKDQAAAAEDHFQVYIGSRGATTYTLNKEWGSLRLTEPGTAGNPPSSALSAPAGGSGITYFTPSLSGVRVGVGAAAQVQAPDGAKGAQYTDLGPRSGKSRDTAGNWQVGGALGYSGLEVGANIGDHSDPTCAAGASCKTNDFWDIGVALRVGSGAISAAYTASQPRSQRADDADRIDIFSLNAGYKVAPGLDIYGGVDWIDLHNTGDAVETPVDTRFMLGTNLRF